MAASITHKHARYPVRWMARGLAGLVVAVLCLGQQCAAPAPAPVPGSGQPRVTLQTNKGIIVVELFDRQAPQTVAAFLALVREGTYDSTIIHDIRPNTHLTGGLYTDAERPRFIDQPGPVPNESSNGLTNRRGRLVAVESADSEGGSSAFRILLADQPSDDYDPESGTPGVTVFGKVVEGMEVADAIGASDTERVTAENSTVLNSVPTPRVRIGRIVEGQEDLPPADDPLDPLGANAGEDRVVAVGLEVMLDGSRSSAGEDGGTLNFAWTQTEGLDVELSDATSAQPRFTVPEGAQTLTFELMVTNEQGATGFDSVTLTVAAEPHVRLDTSMGEILVRMFVEEAPITTNNFMQYVVDGFYDGTIFHRVPANFVIQGGGFLPGLQRQEPLRDPIVNEFSPDRPNVRGTIAMAKTADPDSATSQFFINTKDNPSLNDPENSGGFTVFGEVVEGLDVVDEIQAVETGSQTGPEGNPFNDVPVDDVIVVRATIEEAPEEMDEPDDDGDDDGTDDGDDDEPDEPGEFISRESGLQYRDIVVGQGAIVQPDSTLRVLYEGRLDDENGEVFDSSSDPENPAQFSLTGLIDGWQEGIGEIEMREGGTRQLIIPPDLAYGEAGQGDIPPNATLWFEIDVIEVVE